MYARKVLTTALLFTMFVSLFTALVGEINCNPIVTLISNDSTMDSDSNNPLIFSGEIRGTRGSGSNIDFVSKPLFGSADDVYVVGNYAYVVADYSLLIFDITDKFNPVLLGFCDTDSYSYGVYVVGNYAYLANGEAGLNIINIGTPTSPQSVRIVSVGDIAFEVCVSGSYAYVAIGYSGLAVVNVGTPSNAFLETTVDTWGHYRGVTVSGNYLYIASSGRGVIIYNLDQPDNPIFEGEYTDYDHPEDVSVSEPYAYIADFLDGLIIIRITNKADPTNVGILELDGDSWEIELDSTGSYAYIANGHKGLAVIDVSTPTAPSLVTYHNTMGNAQSVVLDGAHAYAAAWTFGLRIVGISGTPPVLSDKGEWKTGGWVRDILVDNNIAYVAESSAGLMILDVIDPYDPHEEGYLNTNAYSNALYIIGNLLYIADGIAGLRVFDITTPSSPFEVWTLDTKGYALDIDILGPYAYIAHEDIGLKIIDINTHQELGSYDPPDGRMYSVQVRNDFAFTGDSKGLRIINISDPQNPVEVAIYNMSTSGHVGLYVAGSYAYIAESSYGLTIFDITDPSNPELIGGFNRPDSRSVLSIGSTVYLAGDNRLTALNVSDPSSPVEKGYFETGGVRFNVIVDGSYAYLGGQAGGMSILDISQVEDENPPQVNSTSPEDNEVNVLLDVSIVINFTESMDMTSTENAFSYTDGVTTWTASNGVVTWSNNDMNMTFQPSANFENERTYTVTISNTATDKFGDFLDGDGDGIGGEGSEDDYSWSFSTVTTPPQVISSFPEDSTQNVRIDTSIIVNFTKGMNRTSTENAFSYTDGVTSWTASNGVVTWGNNDKSMTFQPFTYFENDRTYNVTINITATDKDNNALDGDGDGTPGEIEEDNYTWEFTTIPSPPKIDSTIPQDGATFVLVDVSMIINFSHSMDKSSTQAALSYTDGNLTFDSSYGLVTWSNNDTTMTFKPTSDFENDKTYTFTIGHTAMDVNLTPLDGDNDGIGGEGIEDDYSWDFITIPTPPKIISTYPETGDQDVKVNTNIIVLFSKSMDRTSVQNAFKYTDGETEWGISNGIVTWSDNDRNFTFTPSSAFDNNLQYWVTIAHTAMDGENVFLDVDGDPTPGEPGEDDYSWSFTTIPLPPQIITTSPLPGSTLVPINSSVTIEFSKTMDKSSTQVALTYTFDGITFGSTNGFVTWSNEDRTMTFAPLVIFQNEMVYIFKIEHTATDIDGIEFDGDEDNNGGEGIEDDYIWSFTTMPVPPKVVSTIPKKNDIDVAVDTIIEVKFTNPMDESSVEDAFTFTHEDTNLTWDASDGIVSWDEDLKIMTFEPSFLLEHEKEYMIKIEATAKDILGITLDGNRNKLPEGVDTDDYISYFTTMPEPPKVESVQPSDGLTDVAIDADIIITFDKSMNKGSTEKAFSYTYEGSDESYDKSDGSIEWTNNDKVLTFDPDLDFEEGERYTVTIEDSAKDVDGIAFEGYEWSFTIKVNSPPVLAGGGVFPEEGDTSKMFKFSIVYTDIDDDRPESIEVVIDDIAWRMLESDPQDEDYTDGKNYEFEISLDEGDHKYHFEGSDEKHDVRFPTGAATKTVKVSAIEEELIFGFLEDQYYGMPTLICGPIGIIFIIVIIISLILIMRGGRPSEETMTFEPFEAGAPQFTFMPTGEEEIMSFTAFEEIPSLEEAKPVLIQCPECEKHLRVRTVTRPFMFPCSCGAKLILK